MKTKTTIILALVFLFFACTENTEIPVNKDDLLLGSWVNATHKNDTLTLKRVNALEKNSYGVTFKENNVFIQRTSGWCGTPPLTFFNLTGSFLVTENLIEVKLQDFPGNFNWRIISLTNKKLVVKRELTNQQKDYQALRKLFMEISILSHNTTCTNGANWSFTAYGAKACGGPQGYIAYSNQIDTANFLKKVAEYTEAENQYNIKWGIVSTCDIPQKPKSVECKKGYPVFKY